MSVKVSFDHHCLDVSLAEITPLRPITPALRATVKYRQIATSVQEIGLVEPLVIFPGMNGKYLLLDGHIRFDVLRIRLVRTARCIVANDDEAHTYNKHVNRLSTIEEHRMILNAIKHGVTESRIAAVLKVDAAAIRRKRDLLDGICPETANLLRDKHMSAKAFRVLGRMKPTRQLKAAELMIAANRYTFPYAKALLAGTPDSLLKETGRHRPKIGIADEQKAILEGEMTALIRDLKEVEDTYASEVLDATIGCRYVERILANRQAHNYLAAHHPDLLDELHVLVQEFQAERKITALGSAPALTDANLNRGKRAEPHA